MSTRKWTKEQKAQKSKEMRQWKPWQHSTGPNTAEGKAISAQNSNKDRAKLRGIKQLIVGEGILKLNEIPEYLIQIKLEHLKIKRLIRKLKNENT